MRSFGQVYTGFAGQQGHPKDAVVRGARACPACHIPKASPWLQANAAPRRQARACGERTSHRWGRSQGGPLILRLGSVPRRARLRLGGITLSACNEVLRNRRCVEVHRRRYPQSGRKAQLGTDGSQGVALLGVWLTGRFTISFVADACGRARWYSDRIRP
jgi:hypothetical protein